MILTKKISFFVIAGSVLLSLAGCGSKTAETTSADGTKTPDAKSVSVDSKGSSFVKPFLENVFQMHKDAGGITVNYQGGGSGAGITAFTDGTVPFAASDAPMSDEEMAEAKTKLGSDVLNLPLVLGGVAVAYNLPEVKDLKLDGAVLAKIFTRKITKWNDPAIAALNAGTTLPDLNITVVVRADGSGTTYVFSDFLSEVDADWKANMGKGKKLNWDASITQSPQNDGVTKTTKEAAGAIAYIETSYAINAGLGMALVKNKEGNFVGPTGAAVTAAGASAVLPADMRLSIVNAAGAESYPISSFVYFLAPADMSKNPSGKGIQAALKYVVMEGQAKAEELHYAKLPEAVQKAVAEKIDAIKVQ